MQMVSRRAGVSICAGVSLGAVLALSAPVSAQVAHAPRRASAPHVTVELIADRETIGPGGPARLGIRFDLDPHWHIYWQNPGESGNPPQVAWSVSSGLSLGAIEWPVPERIDSGGIISYGYTGIAVLPVELKAAAGSHPASPARIDASIKWLVCKDMCVPGTARIGLTLPLPDADRAMVATWRSALDLAQSLVPKPAPSAWRATARVESSAFIIDLHTGDNPAGGLFFPLDAGQIEESGPAQVSPIPGGLRFRLNRSEQLAKDPLTLRGVVSLPGRPAYIVTVPVLPRSGGK